MLRRTIVVLVASAVVACASACTHEQSGPQPVTMSASDKVPAAQGQIQIGSGSNGNTSLHVAVAHMAPAEKMSAGATTYVVWVRPLAADGTPQNLGALSVDKDLTGALDTVTPLKSFEVFVTPEASASVQQPHGQALLWGRVGE
jgi:hypothetical protein